MAKLQDKIALITGGNIRVLARHRIQPVLDSVFPLNEAKVGWAHFADRQLFGKVVFKH
jgi:NADPH:quinone reductase-like Zn-dependent oxidoreductase